MVVRPIPRERGFCSPLAWLREMEPVGESDAPGLVAGMIMHSKNLDELAEGVKFGENTRARMLRGRGVWVAVFPPKSECETGRDQRATHLVWLGPCLLHSDIKEYFPFESLLRQLRPEYGRLFTLFKHILRLDDTFVLLPGDEHRQPNIIWYLPTGEAAKAIAYAKLNTSRVQHPLVPENMYRFCQNQLERLDGTLGSEPATLAAAEPPPFLGPDDLDPWYGEFMAWTGGAEGEGEFRKPTIDRDFQGMRPTLHLGRCHRARCECIYNIDLLTCMCSLLCTFIFRGGRRWLALHWYRVHQRLRLQSHDPHGEGGGGGCSMCV